MSSRLSRFCGSFVVAFFALTVLAGAALADERILRFVSTIDVQEYGDLIVTETITVRAEGNQIKRGIYRDIPLTFEGADGQRRWVGFNLLSVQQDGRDVDHHTRSSSDGIRIYIGSEDVFLKTGRYVYTIRYETTRQIRFFPDHDEVYWNATGNEWSFPIDAAVARVVLPENARATKWTAYTGYYGQKGSDYTAEEEDGGRSILFRTTRILSSGEGMSVVVSLPKGAIAPPTDAQKAGYLLLDHRKEIVGGIGIFLVLVYYLLSWWLVGRDPAKGVIFPRFEAPEGVSPALASYIVNRGFGDGGWKALSAACISLAVKGRLTLENPGDVVTLNPVPDSNPEKGGGRKDPLPKGEWAINHWLRGRSSPLTINKDNGNAVQRLGTKFQSAIENESRDAYFKTNRLFLIPGVALSVLTIFALLVYGNPSSDEVGFLMAGVMITVFGTIMAVNLSKKLRSLGSVGRRVSLALSLFGGIVAFGIIAPAFSFEALFSVSTPVLPILALILLGTNVLFFFLIGAPTALGRQKLDAIEGLKLYLSVAEEERMNMAGAPEMSPTRFETLLPYAVALGVEKPWSDAFQTWLLSAAGAAAATSYAPTWYSGRAFDAHHVSSSMNSVTSAMAGSFVSSLPAPKSSSSGFSSGGGFSGGGGGGGGGGGW